MAKKQWPKQDNKEQSKRFVETAKKLEADESGKSFEKALGVVVKPTADQPRSYAKKPSR